MRQLKDIQVFYAFHFDSLPKNEHETRARFLPRSLEFPKHRNDVNRPWATRLLLLLTNPRSPRICAEDGGRSRVFRRQRISLGQNTAI
jgi:hypothetical protein